MLAMARHPGVVELADPPESTGSLEHEADGVAGRSSCARSSPGPARSPRPISTRSPPPAPWPSPPSTVADLHALGSRARSDRTRPRRPGRFGPGGAVRVRRGRVWPATSAATARCSCRRSTSPRSGPCCARVLADATRKPATAALGHRSARPPLASSSGPPRPTRRCGPRPARSRPAWPRALPAPPGPHPHRGPVAPDRPARSRRPPVTGRSIDPSPSPRRLRRPTGAHRVGPAAAGRRRRRRGRRRGSRGRGGSGRLGALPAPRRRSTDRPPAATGAGSHGHVDPADRPGSGRAGPPGDAPRAPGGELDIDGHHLALGTPTTRCCTRRLGCADRRTRRCWSDPTGRCSASTGWPTPGQDVTGVLVGRVPGALHGRSSSPAPTAALALQAHEPGDRTVTLSIPADSSLADPGLTDPPPEGHTMSPDPYPPDRPGRDRPELDRPARTSPDWAGCPPWPPSSAWSLLALLGVGRRLPMPPLGVTGRSIRRRRGRRGSPGVGPAGALDERRPPGGHRAGRATCSSLVADRGARSGRRPPPPAVARTPRVDPAGPPARRRRRRARRGRCRWPPPPSAPTGPASADTIAAASTEPPPPSATGPTAADSPRPSARSIRPARRPRPTAPRRRALESPTTRDARRRRLAGRPPPPPHARPSPDLDLRRPAAPTDPTATDRSGAAEPAGPSPVPATGDRSVGDPSAATTSGAWPAGRWPAPGTGHRPTPRSPATSTASIEANRDGAGRARRRRPRAARARCSLLPPVPAGLTERSRQAQRDLVGQQPTLDRER